MNELAVLDPATVMGRVDLTVRDLDRVASFYQDAIGLHLHDQGLYVDASVGDSGPLVRLYHEPDATLKPRRTVGLYHFAILVPNRRDLGVALRRIARHGALLHGASDHLVSEALYLSDPEGNGIEIYRDRPRHEWPAAPSGVVMDSLPLDIDSIGDEAGDDDAARLPAGTRMGHVHLHVGDLRAAEKFYIGVLGFTKTFEMPGADFVAAGGYHHHLGLNTWAGSAPPPPGSTGLRSFEIVLPTSAGVAELQRRLEDASVESQAESHGLRLRDPFGNALVVASSER